MGSRPFGAAVGFGDEVVAAFALCSVAVGGAPSLPVEPATIRSRRWDARRIRRTYTVRLTPMAAIMSVHRKSWKGVIARNTPVPGVHWCWQEVELRLEPRERHLRRRLTALKCASNREATLEVGTALGQSWRPPAPWRAHRAAWRSQREQRHPRKLKRCPRTSIAQPAVRGGRALRDRV